MKGKKSFKKWTSKLLSCAMMVSFIMPAVSKTITVNAQTNVKTINLRTSGIMNPTEYSISSTSWVGDYVYFGGYNGSAIKNRVLDTSATEFGGNTMLLDCDSVLENKQFDSKSNVWSSSALKTYLNGDFFNNDFTEIEKNAIAVSTKLISSQNDGNVDMKYAALKNEKIFVLDAAEVTRRSYGYSYGTDDDANRVKKNLSGENTSWYLRSAQNVGTQFGAAVTQSGNLCNYNVPNIAYGVSPAFNLDLSSILFTSVKELSKSSHISTVENSSGKEWTLTLKDTSKSVEVASNQSVKRSGNTITVPYTYTGGDVSQISVMITDKPYTEADATILYYGKLEGTLSAAGTEGSGTFTLPSGLSSTAKVYMLAEDVNDDSSVSLTDYASTPVEITIPASNETGIEKQEVCSVTTVAGDTTNYINFSEALNAAENNKGSTLKLLSDVLYNKNIFIYGYYTLDLNGHKLDLGTNHAYICSTEGSTIIRDSGTGGVFISTDHTFFAMGKLIIESGTVKTTGTSAVAIWAKDNADIKINGGTFIGVRSDVTFLNVKAEIRGGDFTHAGLEVYSNSTTILKGGKFNLIYARGDKTVSDLLGEGYCYYDSEGKIYTPSETQNKIEQIVTVGKKTVYNVNLSSRLTNGTENNDINLENEGSYSAGTTVTVKAPYKEGLIFKGWYTASSETLGYSGSVLSNNLNYTFDINEDKKLVAVYEPNLKANVKITGSNFTVKYLNSESQIQRSEYIGNIPIGTSVTLTAKDKDKFLYWMNGNGKIVSTSLKYTFTVTGDTNISMTCAEVEASKAFVEFVSPYNQIISSATYDANSAVVFPDGPSKVGYIFTGWNMTQDDIHAAITKGEKHIKVKPVYKAKNINYTITVYTAENGTLLNETPENYSDLTPGTVKTIKAPIVQGKKFKCWSSDKEGTKILGTSESYFMQMSKNVTLYVIYVNETSEVNKVPTIAITNKYPSYVSNIEKISFVSTRDVPEGYTLVEQGMLYNKNGSITNPTNDSFVVNGINVNQYISTDIATSGVFTLNVKIANKNTTIYVRGYMVVRNNSTGNEQIIYSEIESAKYIDFLN